MCLGFVVDGLDLSEERPLRTSVTASALHHRHRRHPLESTDDDSPNRRRMDDDARFCVYVNGKRCALRDGIGETTALEFLRGTTTRRIFAHLQMRETPFLTTLLSRRNVRRATDFTRLSLTKQDED